MFESRYLTSNMECLSGDRDIQTLVKLYKKSQNRGPLNPFNLGSWSLSHSLVKSRKVKGLSYVSSLEPSEKSPFSEGWANWAPPWWAPPSAWWWPWWCSSTSSSPPRWSTLQQWWRHLRGKKLFQESPSWKGNLGSDPFLRCPLQNF